MAVPENHSKFISISAKLGTPQSFMSALHIRHTQTGATKLESHLLQTDPRQ